MIPKFPKRTYEYHGTTNPDFVNRIEARCPGCSPGNTAGDEGEAVVLSPTYYQSSINERVIGTSMLTEDRYAVVTIEEVGYQWRIHLFSINDDYTVTELDMVEFNVNLGGVASPPLTDLDGYLASMCTLGDSYVVLVYHKLITGTGGMSGVYAMLAPVDLTTGTITAPTGYQTLATYYGQNAVPFVAKVSDTEFILVAQLTEGTGYAITTFMVTLTGTTFSTVSVDTQASPSVDWGLKDSTRTSGGIKMCYNPFFDLWYGRLVGMETKPSSPTYPQTWGTVGFAMTNAGYLDISGTLATTEEITSAFDGVESTTHDYGIAHTPSTGATIIREYNNTTIDASAQINTVAHDTYTFSTQGLDTLEGSTEAGYFYPACVYLSTETKDRIVMFYGIQRASTPSRADYWMAEFDPPSMSLRKVSQMGLEGEPYYGTRMAKNFPDVLVGRTWIAPYAITSPRAGRFISGTVRLV